MAQKDRYTSLFKGITGKNPESTAKSRQEDIDRQMEGLPPKKKADPNSKEKVSRRGYSVHKMDEA